MENAGRVVGRALATLRDAARPGMTTSELDRMAETIIREAGATPTFLGYEGFPASICASVNDTVVHGIPSDAVRLAEGDVISIDCGATLDGWVGDSALSFTVGDASALAEADRELIEATEWVMWQGIAAVVPGARLSDVSHALEQATRAAERRYGRPFGIVDGYGGHGIGHEMHEDPFLPNEGKPGRGPIISEGTTLCVEPMLTLGECYTHELDDGWTVVTDDGSRSAHFEHTVAATGDGPRILTPRPIEEN